jgi:hypothetical protein
MFGCAICALMAYGGSYYRISRRSLAELKPYDIEGFLYVPADEVFRAKNLETHYRWVMFYAPANWIDQSIFGGPPPVRSIMFDLSR